MNRVAERVRMGGHNVPEETIRRRYYSGIRNFFKLYRPLTDKWFFYDNSAAEPRIIAYGEQERYLVVKTRQYGIIFIKDMAIKQRHRDKITEVLSDPDKITKALVQGVREALLKHKQAGNSIVIWKDGKTVWLKPEEIPV